MATWLHLGWVVNSQVVGAIVWQMPDGFARPGHWLPCLQDWHYSSGLQPWLPRSFHVVSLQGPGSAGYHTITLLWSVAKFGLLGGQISWTDSIHFRRNEGFCFFQLHFSWCLHHTFHVDSAWHFLAGAHPRVLVVPVPSATGASRDWSALQTLQWATSPIPGLSAARKHPSMCRVMGLKDDTSCKRTWMAGEPQCWKYIKLMVMEREKEREEPHLPMGDCARYQTENVTLKTLCFILFNWFQLYYSSLFKFKRCWIFFKRANGALGVACRIYVNGLHFMNDHMQLIFCQLGMASNCQESVRNLLWPPDSVNCRVLLASRLEFKRKSSSWPWPAA